MDLRNWNAEMIYDQPKPIFVDKETRDGFTTSMNLVGKERKYNTLTLIPHKGIYNEQKEMDQLKDVIYIGPNNSYCSQIIPTKMPFNTKREVCYKCNDWHSGRCLISQMLDSLENGGKHQIFMHYMKLMNMKTDSLLGQILRKYVDYFIADECTQIINGSYEDLKWKQVSMTGIDEIDQRIITCRNMKIGDEIEFDRFEEWYDLYQDEEDNEADENYGNMLIKFSGEKFERTKKGIRIYKDQSNWNEWVEECAERFIFSEAGKVYDRFRQYMKISMFYYRWVKKMKHDTHYILVDNFKLDIDLLKTRIDKMIKIDRVPLVVFTNKKVHKKYANGHFSTYYQSTLTKGVERDEKFIILIDLPWLPQDAKDQEEDMISIFSQAADRVKKKGQFSYAYVTGVPTEEVKHFYKGEGKIIEMAKGSYEYLDLILELIENEDIEDDEVVYVAKAIYRKTNPGNTLIVHDKVYIAKKYIKLIRAYRKERKKEEMEK